MGLTGLGGLNCLTNLLAEGSDGLIYLDGLNCLTN